MAATSFRYLLLAFLLCSSVHVWGQGMAVNTTGTAAASSAMLDVSSTTQGVLVPRMTAAQRTAIATPATGLLVYETDVTPGFWFYNGAAWASLNAPTGWGATGNAGTDPATNFIGTTDAKDLVLKTNSTERLRLSATNGSIAIPGGASLGELAPATKTAVLTGTTHASMGGLVPVTIPAAIPADKILSIQLVVNYGGPTDWVPSFYTYSSGYEAEWYTLNAVLYVVNKSGNSAAILNKPFKAVITYLAN